MMIFFFIKKRKIKHSIVTVYFYFEIEREKGRFITVISKLKWYYFAFNKQLPIKLNQIFS